MSLSFVCSVCSNPLSKPCRLPGCNHTFCFDCLEPHVTQRPDDVAVVICPNCHISSRCITSENIKYEFADPVTETLIEVFGGNPPTFRETCVMECGKDAEFWCQKCEFNLCSNCLSTQHGSVAFQKHSVVPIHQKKYCLESECPVCQIKSTTFCQPCQKIVCGNCIATDHKNHDLSEITFPTKPLLNLLREIDQSYQDSMEILEKAEIERKKVLKQLQRWEKFIIGHTSVTTVLNTSSQRLNSVLPFVKDEQVVQMIEQSLKNKILRTLERNEHLRGKLFTSDSKLKEQPKVKAKAKAKAKADANADANANAKPVAKAKAKAKATAKAKAKAQPKAKAKAKTQPKAGPAQQVVGVVVPKAEPKPQATKVELGTPKQQPKIVAKSAPKQQPKNEAKPAPAAKQQAKTDPKTAPKQQANVDPKPTPKQQANVDPKPAPKQQANVDPKPAPVPKQQTKDEVKSVPKPQAKDEAKPVPKQKAKVEGKVGPKKKR